MIDLDNDDKRLLADVIDPCAHASQRHVAGGAL
jgi:hypothetical protein